MPYDIQISKITQDRTAVPDVRVPVGETGRLTPATDGVEGLQVVGLAGFEPATSSLSGMRSNQLSYRPPAGLASLIQD